MDIDGQAHTLKVKTHRPRGRKPKRARPAPGALAGGTLGDMTYQINQDNPYVASGDYANDISNNATDFFNSTIVNPLDTGAAGIAGTISNFLSTYGGLVLIGMVIFMSASHHE